MQIWMTLILAVQLLSALAMIGLVLIQHGKGADMGASFGSGASGSLFGATGSANFLSRSTAVLATVFFVCTLALTYFSNSNGGRNINTSGSVLDRAGPAASAPASAPAANAIPGVVPAVTPAASVPVTSSVPTPAAEPVTKAASAVQK